MTPKDIAEKLNGIEYNHDFLSNLEVVAAAAKQHGVVIVYGASDDLMEFEGAFRKELGAPCEARIGRSGPLKPWSEIDHDDIEEARDYFNTEREGKWSIESLWEQEPGISWTFKTNIPHETFNIMEYGDVFCRGIVFSINDLK